MSLVHRNPLVLIHGIDDTVAVFDQAIAYLRQRGWSSFHPLNLTPNNGNAGLDALASQVANYVERQFSTEQPIDLLGFSMGGLVSRYYVQRLGGIERVQRFVTVSAPHQGSWLAYGRWNSGCEQMRPNSLFIQDLSQDIRVLSQTEFTSIWTPYDLMIVPAESSRLPVGREIKVPVLTHSGMLTSHTGLTAIHSALTASSLANVTVPL
ncbi:MAG: alpha/beta fold hydrolase [Leptolyngbyaceae cyanobacterium SM1_1_3]|nr:alpha/beta fold hydrolase [Leptolyngbyaceae cyanobacterium SM1_1_3]NJM85738.1 alpha/beta fold hydrolase [Leptolyngbyaceae cyanobacterium RM2_2_21]NJN02359.1 alpha/beta fold hydrolase [Leptolyngbyaceae cyanobacterium RM1_1_2]NJO10393.1 alpha/beta fold hydrolase [Leptolyngbyaceae cyanobacterium SL_1_1]